MCLEKIIGGAKIAKQDIVCYKVVLRGYDGFVTYYQQSPICIGDTYHSKIEFPYKSDYITVALHSFKKRKDAIQRMHDDDEHPTPIPIVVKCFIPKGSTYYTGQFDSKVGWLNAYASDTITYNKIIE